MLPRIVFICFFAFGLSGFGQGSQGSLEQYENWFLPATPVTAYRPQFRLEVKDGRSASGIPLDLEAFSANIPETLDLFMYDYFKGQEDLPELPSLEPKKMILEMEKFQIVENSSGKAVLLAEVLVKLQGGDFSSLNSEFKVSAEEVTSIKMKNLDNPKQDKKLAPLLRSFSENFGVKIVRSLLPWLEEEEAYVLQLKTLGKDLTQTTDTDASHKKASLNALVKASDLAFGTSLFQDQEVQEFREVEERIHSAGGRLLYSELDPQASLNTTDGYSCVLLVSVIKKK